MYKKALLIVNFHSGMGKARTVLAEVIETLSKYDIMSLNSSRLKSHL